MVFTLAAAPQDGWDRVGSVGLTDGSRRTVARSEWPSGLINRVAVAGDWVAWVDQSHRQGDADPRVLWRVWALDTATHERRPLASDGDPPRGRQHRPR